MMRRLWRPRPRRSWFDEFGHGPPMEFVPAEGEPVPGGIGPQPAVSVEAAQDMLRELRRLWLREAAARVEALPTHPSRVLDDDGSSYSRWINRRDALAAIMRDDAS